jgi:NCS1 family nucleobase:cation symporter-1
MSFFTGFGVSSLIYYVLNRIFPPPGAFQKFEEIDESNFELEQQEEVEKRAKESDGASIDEKDKGSETGVDVKPV